SSVAKFFIRLALFLFLHLRVTPGPFFARGAMTRCSARLRLVVGAAVALTLFHVLWPSSATQPAAAFDAKLLDALTARPIGPANMGGRIVDVAVVESDPRIMYVATASGGLWKTTNGGDTFQPVFDHQSSVCIGGVAVSQSDPDVVWVGTGEANPRNSVA